MDMLREFFNNQFLSQPSPGPGCLELSLKNIHDRDQSVTCHHCCQGFPEKRALLRHIAVVHTRGEVSSNCGELWTDEAAFKVHFEKHLAKTKPRCDKRDERSLNSKSAETKPFRCNECQKAFTKKATMIVHRYAHAAKLQCMACDEIFISKLQLDVHRVKQHAERRLHKCSRCSNAYASHKLLSQHVTATHNEKRSLACQYCGKNCKSKRVLQIHENTHTKLSFECTMCVKSYCSKYNLQRHAITVHRLKAPITCGVCLKRFKSVKIFSKHQRAAHKIAAAEWNVLDQREVWCEFCKMQFCNDVHMPSHAAVHVGLNAYKCYVCNKVFKDLSSLKIHMKSHAKQRPLRIKH